MSTNPNERGSIGPGSNGVHPASTGQEVPKELDAARSGSGLQLSRRAWLGIGLMGVGVGAQAFAERLGVAERPPLKMPLAEAIPMRFGDWIGRDVAVDPHILSESQADDYLNRTYRHRTRPNRKVSVWLNFSQVGANMRHSPEVCLPSSGWTALESASQVRTLDRGPDRDPHVLSALAYAKGKESQWIGFWYYIFGETGFQRMMRQLPITNRSSHGRATRGSGLTIELFGPRRGEPHPEALEAFALEFLDHLEPALPDDRVAYHEP